MEVGLLRPSRTNSSSTDYLRTTASYADLGGDFFDRLEPERLTRYYVKRLERLGHKVTLEPTLPPDLNKFSEQGEVTAFPARVTL